MTFLSACSDCSPSSPTAVFPGHAPAAATFPEVVVGGNITTSVVVKHDSHNAVDDGEDGEVEQLKKLSPVAAPHLPPAPGVIVSLGWFL